MAFITLKLLFVAAAMFSIPAPSAIPISPPPPSVVSTAAPSAIPIPPPPPPPSVTVASSSLSVSAVDISSHPVVTISDSTDPNAAPVFLSCAVGGHQILNNTEMRSGEEMQLKINHRGRYFCTMDWDIYSANFQLYHQEVDGMRSGIVCIVDDDGVSMGWDGEGLTIVAEWELWA